MFLGLNRFCSLTITENKIILENHHTEAYLYLSPKLAILLYIINEKNNYIDIINEIKNMQGLSNKKAKNVITLVIQKLGDFLTISQYPVKYGNIDFTIEDIIKNYSKFKIKTIPILPSQIHLMLTNHCNHSCIYCEKNAIYTNETVANISSDYLTQTTVEDVLASYMRTNIAPHFILTGGEPLLNPYLIDIAKSIKKHDFQVMLVTKGMNDLDKFRKLCKCAIDKIRFSLDSYNQEKEDSIAGVGTYEQLINCLSIAKRYNSEIIINTVLLQENYKDIEEIIKHCIHLEVKKIHFVVVRPQGRCKKELALTQKEMIECKYRTLELQDKYYNQIRIVFTCDYTNCDKDICKNCAKRFEVINIHKDGMVTSCGQKHYLGSLKKNDLKTIWNKYILELQHD